MNWTELAAVILDGVFEGFLYRGTVSTNMRIKSTPNSLEIGPLDWELPKTVRFDRSDRIWFYKENDEWTEWPEASVWGVSVFALIDPRYYALNSHAKTGEEFLEPDVLQVSFKTSALLESMDLPRELLTWCTDLMGDMHQVKFLTNDETNKDKPLKAMSQSDFWLNGEDSMTVVFGNRTVSIPFALREALLK